MTSYVDLVCPPLEIVCCVIDGYCVLLLKMVAMDVDFVMFGICETGRFGIILLVEDLSKEVVHQLWNEVLISKLIRYLTGMCRNECLESWIIYILTICPLVEPQVATAPFRN